MGYGCRHNFSIVVERYDLDGVCNVLKRRVDKEPGAWDDQSYHAGAYRALDMLRNHEWRDQEEFFDMFDALRRMPLEVADG